MRYAIIALMLVAVVPALAQEPTQPPIATAAPSMTPSDIPPTPSFGGDNGVTPVFSYEPNPGSYNWSYPTMPELSTATPIYELGEDGSSPSQALVEENLGEMFGDASDMAAGIDDFSTMPDNFFGDGMPTDPQAEIEDMYADLLFFFSVLKGFSPDNFGKLGILYRYSVIFLLIFLVIRLSNFFILVFSAVLGVARKLIELIIPGM